MPKTYQSNLDRVFAVLSDPTRRSIISRLKEKDYTVMEIAGHYDMSFQAVSKHLTLIEKANLLHRKRDGKHFICSYNAGPLGEAITWIAKNHAFWQHNFDALQDFLDTQPPKPKK